ncbi:MAG TPA: hypothetical protein VKZ63_04125 [Kofleriaceae bacterium]|nr:hypothetical protein [Kofleriaceae bacterium]
MRNRFSLGWVVVSYFLICGGLTAAGAAYALAAIEDPRAGHAAFFVGAAIGGFLAGRASPHRSYLEPALAASLVVVSIIAFVHATPMGKYGIALAKSAADVSVWKHAAIAGGLGFAGGFLGALVGEAMQPRRPGALGLRWLLLGVFISAGALFVGSTAAAIILVNEAAEKALGQMMTGGLDPSRPLLSEDRITVAAAATAASASILGGLVTQLGAPVRALLPSAGGAFLVLGGAVLGVAALVGRAPELVGPAIVVATTAGVLALVGALVSYLVGRASGRLS